LSDEALAESGTPLFQLVIGRGNAMGTLEVVLIFGTWIALAAATVVRYVCSDRGQKS
jgi:hypothetical protein